MPVRGYRKGVSDNRIASPRRIHTRLPEKIHADLMLDAGSRSRSASFINRAIVVAHYEGKRIELPHPRTVDASLLHEWNRIGNNLNQLLPHAHRMRLHLIEKEVRACLAAITVLIKRMP